MSELPTKMKAVVAHAPGDYRLETVDTPRAGVGEMVLKVEACGICAGDVKAFLGAKVFGEETGIRHISSLLWFPDMNSSAQLWRLEQALKETGKLVTGSVRSRLFHVENVCFVRRADTGCVRNMICLDFKIM